MRVFITQRIFPEGLELLERAGFEIDLNDETKPLLKADLIGRAQRATGVLYLLTDTLDGEGIAAAPDLKAIANVAVGYNIDVAAATVRP